MFKKKEKQIKKVLLNDDVDFTLEDKEDILINIKSKLNLEPQEEKPSLRRSFNLKVVYGLVCSLVICVIGYVGYLLFNQNGFIDPDYRGKDVESLNLAEGDYCLAYCNELTKNHINYLNERFQLQIDYEKNIKSYIVVKDSNIILIIDGSTLKEYLIEFSISSDLIIEKHKSTYDSILNKNILNNNRKGLLFLVYEKGVEFYTKKNNKKLSIFVEF